MTQNKLVKEIAAQDYQYGFVTDIESETVAPGLDESVIRFISAKNEPEWLLELRLAPARWRRMTPPDWAKLEVEPIDYQAISYYSAPKPNPKLESLDQVDPKLLETYEKLGIPLEEQKRLANVAVDVVFDSVSVTTTFKDTLAKAGVIFCPISEAVQKYPELVRQYLGTVVPAQDNFFSALNAAVFTDGSFVYIPEGVKCPMELSTYFRINEQNTGQFERTLIIAEKGSHVSYLEGARRLSATRTSCMPRWSSWWPMRTPRSNTLRFRTGIQAMKRAEAASTTSSPNEDRASARAPRSRGRRLRPAQRSPGNTRAVCSSATTRSASSIRWR